MKSEFKETFKLIPISDFRRGDKIVPKDAKLRSCGIWTVTGIGQYLITAYCNCRVNGKPKDEHFGPEEIIRRIGKDGQMEFAFMY